MAKKTKIEHYWLCAKCAEKKGGVFPEGHVCTCSSGECPYCKTKGVTLIPYVDFNWPKDPKLDRHSRINRD